MIFEVWAPRPERVRLLADGATAAMERDEAGWWRVEVPVSGEVDYGYLLDDDPTPRPDPRSRRQPEGVHGLSRTYDAATFAWSDSGWTGRQLAGSVVYELHLGTFTPEGTLDAAIAGWTTWSRSASTWSSCCRSTPSTAPTTGGTTGSAGSR